MKARDISLPSSGFIEALTHIVRERIPNAVEDAKQTLVDSVKARYAELANEYPGSVGYLITMQTHGNEEKVLAAIKQALGEDYKNLHTALFDKHKLSGENAGVSTDKDANELILAKLQEMHLSVLRIQQTVWGSLPAEHTNIKCVENIKKSEDDVFRNALKDFLKEEIRNGITYEGIVERAIKQGMEYHERISLFYALNEIIYPQADEYRSLKEKKSGWIDNSKGEIDRGKRQQLLAQLLPLFPGKEAVLALFIVPDFNKLQEITKEILRDELKNIWEQYDKNPQNWNREKLYLYCAGKLFSYQERNQSIAEFFKITPESDIASSPLAKRITYTNKVAALAENARLKGDADSETLRKKSSPKNGEMDVNALEKLLVDSITDPSKGTIRTFKLQGRKPIHEELYGNKLRTSNAHKKEKTSGDNSDKTEEAAVIHNGTPSQSSPTPKDPRLQRRSATLSLNTALTDDTPPDIFALIMPVVAPDLTPPPARPTRPAPSLTPQQSADTTLTLRRSNAQQKPKPLPRRPSLPSSLLTTEAAPRPVIRVEELASPSPSYHRWQQRLQKRRPLPTPTASQRPRSVSSTVDDRPSSLNLRERYEALIKGQPATETGPKR